MPEEKDATSTTILVVDDSKTDRTLVTGLIAAERPDWELLACEAAAEGLDILDRQPVSVVVTDLFMPEMSGEEFLVEIRLRFPTVPVILITSQGSDEIAARSLELGAVNYVPKRRLSDDLVPAIDEILRAEGEAKLARDILTHLVRSQTIFRIDSDLEQIRSLLHLIRERLQSLRALQDEEVRQVADAVREALMNAHTHGRRTIEVADGSTDDATRLAASVIEVELTQTPERVCFSIKDQGTGFDTSILSDPDGTTAGNGFRTMRRNMDSIEVNEVGNQIALTKDLVPPESV